MPHVYGDFGNWFTDTLKSVVPSHTVVGKLLGGDTAGAVKDAAKLVQAKPAAPAAKAQPAPGGLMGAGGVFAPGGWVDQNRTLLLVAAAGLGAFLILGRRSRR